jgi:hypothetical protein
MFSLKVNIRGAVVGNENEGVASWPGNLELSKGFVVSAAEVM